MKNEIKSGLDAIFEKHEVNKANTASAQQIAQNKEQACLEEFVQLRDTVISPAMTAIGKYIEAKGYRFRIVQIDDGTTKERYPRPIQASIQIQFYKGIQPHEMHGHPGLTVTCEKTRDRVSFYESMMWPESGGTSGPAGEAALSEITEDLIHQKLLKIVAAVFT